MSSGFCIKLTPNSFDARPKAHTLGERQWNLAVRMVDRAGFRPNIVGGLSRADVPMFADYLKRALSTERLSDTDKAILNKLVAFLTTDGAKVRGLTLSRGYLKWNEQ